MNPFWETVGAIRRRRLWRVNLFYVRRALFCGVKALPL